MREFDELKNHIEDGNITLVNAIGVPRSMSTAFCRALNESDEPSVYVNEPFNRNNRSLDKASHFILEACKPFNDEKPITVITKNMASYMPLESFLELDAVATASVWHIRQPQRQIGSLLTRLANDLFVSPGANAIRQEDLAPYLEDLCDYLIDSPKSKDFSKTGWKSIHTLHDHAVSKVNIIDGDDFAKHPGLSLSRVCDAAGLPFSERMLDGWGNPFINVINAGNETETSSSEWTRDAATSQGVHEVGREDLDLDSLPKSLQEHIRNVALPVYGLLRRSGGFGV